jgi:hypothetical protein
MARETKLSSHGEQFVEPIDLDELGSQFRSCRSQPSIAQDDPFPADSVPLFLSAAAEQPEQPGSGKIWHRAVMAPRILKAGIGTLTAAVVGLAVLSMQNPLWLFAKTKAPLPAMSAHQPGTGLSTPAIQSAAIVSPPTAKPAAKEVPTREEIAAAFRAAQQGQTGIGQQPAAAPPARRLEADELAALLKRAKGLIAVGDIAPARLLLERAADAQEAGAALLLAQTYDPAVLGTPDARSITPDPVMARAWYQKAAQFGSPDARQRLAQMQD